MSKQCNPNAIFTLKFGTEMFGTKRIVAKKYAYVLDLVEMIVKPLRETFLPHHCSWALYLIAFKLL